MELCIAVALDKPTKDIDITETHQSANISKTNGFLLRTFIDILVCNELVDHPS